MKIAIVILNWNGKHWLEQFLPTVVSHAGAHPVYLADNASTDDSITWAQTHYPNVQIIAMDRNRGYAGGYNTALTHINEPFACLLNSDVATTYNWLEPVLERFASNPMLGAIQPKILDHAKPASFEYAGAAGGYLDRLAFPYCRGRIFHTLEKDAGQYNDRPKLDWASGAALFVRITAFRQVAGMDTDYFAHQEEVDLCWRMRAAGYMISYEPDSVVYHVGGGTLKASSPTKTFYNFRNSLFNIVKNEHSKLWIVILVLRIMLDGIAALRFLLVGNNLHFFAVLKAHVSFYSFFFKMLKKRRSFPVKVANTGVRSIVWQYFGLKKKIFIRLP